MCSVRAVSSVTATCTSEVEAVASPPGTSGSRPERSRGWSARPCGAAQEHFGGEAVGPEQPRVRRGQGLPEVRTP